MKKSFEKPEIQVIQVGNTDIITTSSVEDVYVFGHEVWSPWIEI